MNTTSTLLFALLLFQFACTNKPPNAPTAISTSEFNPSEHPRPDESVRQKNNPIELGIVSWKRDIEAAKKESKATQKPLLILFNEVPGCDTVKGFGENVLSNADIKAVIEEAFIPLFIQNNSNEDASLLKEYNEPAWNNPILRAFKDGNVEVGKRFAGPYKKQPFAVFLIQALTDSKNDIPETLLNISSTPRVKKAYFAMYCFWTGEAKFGNIVGVFNTRPGFMNGHEVVEVHYDETRISYETLLRRAKKDAIADIAIVSSAQHQRLAATIFGTVERQESLMRFSKKDDKYFLKRSRYKDLELSPFQATKINAAIQSGTDPSRYLKTK